MPDAADRPAFKERPLLFGTPMVRAILDRGKTQTRRLLKPQPEYRPDARFHRSKLGGWVWGRPAGPAYGAFALPDLLRDLTVDAPAVSAMGGPLDRIWVREAFAWDEGAKRFAYRADGGESPTGRWRPSIFMPRQACRLELEIESVRVEHVRDLSDADARAEGIFEPATLPDGSPRGSGTCWSWGGPRTFASPYLAYLALWDAINPDHPARTNPAVLVVTFRRLEASRD